MTHLELATALILAWTTVVLISWDVFVRLRQRDGEATISWVLLMAAKAYPVIAFALGFVFGHIFWQNCGP